MELSEFFKIHNRVAVAFSGGVDSAYLVYAAKQCGAELAAYFVKSQFQPEFELRDAKSLCDELNIPLKVIKRDVLAISEVAANGAERCYYCKKALFSEIKSAALKDGFDELLDGTNRSDVEADRPGMRAKNELSVLSPLRLCGLTKSRIRALSKEAGLFLHDKPAYSCLATRVATGQAITGETLAAVEKSEELLFSLGFSDFRVRVLGSCATLELRENDFVKAADLRREIYGALMQHFDRVLLDMKPRDGEGG